jgi:hypothetical protein
MSVMAGLPIVGAVRKDRKVKNPEFQCHYKKTCCLAMYESAKQQVACLRNLSLLLFHNQHQIDEASKSIKMRN